MKQQGLCEHLWKATGVSRTKGLRANRMEMECELCGVGGYPDACETIENECVWSCLGTQVERLTDRATNNTGDKMTERKAYDDYKREILDAATEEEADQIFKTEFLGKRCLGEYAERLLRMHVSNEKSVLGGFESDPRCALDRQAITRMQRGMQVFGMVPVDVDKEMEAHRQLVLDYVATAAEWVPMFLGMGYGRGNSGSRAWEYAAIEAVRKLQEKRQQ